MSVESTYRVLDYDDDPNATLIYLKDTKAKSLHLMHHMSDDNECGVVIMNPLSIYNWMHINCSHKFRNTKFICERSLNNDPLLTRADLKLELYTCINSVYYNNSCYYFEIKERHTNFKIEQSSSEQMSRLFSAWSKGILARQSIHLQYLNKQLKYCLCLVNDGLLDEELKNWKRTQCSCTKSHFQLISKLPLQYTDLCTRGNIFMCKDSTCILSLYLCDGKHDCPDNSDEIDCTNICTAEFDCLVYCPIHVCQCSKLHLHCTSHECIPLAYRCDGISQCRDSSDEINCFLLEITSIATTGTQIQHIMLANNDSICLDGWSLCSTKHKIFCYPTDKICVYETYPKGHLFCPNTEQLHYCEFMSCPSMFKCDRDYCISTSMVCDGKFDCPTGADEINCTTLVCPGLLKCRFDSVCVHPVHTCDGVVHCHLSGDDEAYCRIVSCPDLCVCKGHLIHCTDKIPPYSVLNKLDGFIFQDIRIIWHYQFEHCYSLRYIFIEKSLFSGNRLRRDIFRHTFRLVSIEIIESKIIHIETDTFRDLVMLKKLNLKGNDMVYFQNNILRNLGFLEELDLSMMKLRNVEIGAFRDLKLLKHLNLSYNKLITITDFKSNGILLYVDLRGNYNIESLSSMGGIFTLVSSKLIYCCYMWTKNNCRSNVTMVWLFPNKYRCQNTTGNKHINVAILLINSLICLLNCCGIVAHNKLRQHHTQRTILINLHLSDLLQSLYILIVCIFMYVYENSYIFILEEWPTSKVCRAAGTLLLLCDIFSGYIIILLSISNLVVTKYALKLRSFRATETLCLSAIGWFLSVVISTGMSTIYLTTPNLTCYIDLMTEQTFILCIVIVTFRFIAISIYIDIYRYVVYISMKFNSLSLSKQQSLFKHVITVSLTELLNVVLMLITTTSFQVLESNDKLDIHLMLILMKLTCISVCNNFTFLYRKLIENK